MNDTSDNIAQSRTTAALLTPAGRGAVATIRYDGDCRQIDQAGKTMFRAANGKPLDAQPIDRVVFGRWGEQMPEEVVVCRIENSALEIHCHGGAAAARRILNDLESVGCRIVTWPEMFRESRGAFEVECCEALTRATTFRTADILLEQQSGVLRFALESLHVAAQGASHDGTAPSVELEAAPGEFPASASEQNKSLANQLDEILKWADFGLHLTQLWSVVLAGRPNVGKSSMINALLGYARSIVYDEPGTTRDVVTAATAFDGWPIQLADTAGIRDDADELERAGIEFARERLAFAHCRIILLDTSRAPHPDDQRLLSDWEDSLVVAHKCDLPNVWEDQLPPHALNVSSLTGEGIDTLANTLVERLVPEVPPPGAAIPVTERQVRLLKEAREAVERADWESCRKAIGQCLS